jgi:hypothetical protein
MFTPIKKAPLSIALIAISLCISVGCSREMPTQPQAASEALVSLTTFEHEITSTATELKVKPGQLSKVPVTIKNPTKDTWTSLGRAPVVISYKWFSQGQMLPDEGERTLLPQILRPNESASAEVKVLAPEKPGNLVLKITLVQEGVVWFMSRGAKPLELSVKSTL